MIHLTNVSLMYVVVLEITLKHMQLFVRLYLFNKFYLKMNIKKYNSFQTILMKLRFRKRYKHQIVANHMDTSRIMLLKILFLFRPK